MNLSDLSKQMVITSSCVVITNNTLVQNSLQVLCGLDGWNLRKISVSYSDDCECAAVLCSLVDRHQHFGGTCCLHLQWKE
jgi:hypothetical protein